MLPSEFLERQSSAFAGIPPEEAIGLLLRSFDRVAIAFSGAEDVILIDMAKKSGSAFEVFCLDTGRLHPETYRYIDRVRSNYDVDIELLSPDAGELEPFVRAKGLFSFFQDGHHECCGIRKVAPLRRKLAQLDAWITGQRRDQSPGTRSDVNALELDKIFEGRSGELLKSNPLWSTSSSDVWQYIRSEGLPYNELHSKGYHSIGCEPCTRPVLPGQHEREGRWWWEEQTKKECGLHAKS